MSRCHITLEGDRRGSRLDAHAAQPKSQPTTPLATDASQLTAYPTNPTRSQPSPRYRPQLRQQSAALAPTVETLGQLQAHTRDLVIQYENRITDLDHALESSQNREQVLEEEVTRATRTAERTQLEQGDAEKQATEDTERIMELEKECNELRIESELAKELMDQAEVLYIQILQKAVLRSLGKKIKKQMPLP